MTDAFRDIKILSYREYRALVEHFGSNTKFILVRFEGGELVGDVEGAQFPFDSYKFIHIPRSVMEALV